jgi:purine-nucleoside phosphorylase
MAGTPQNTRHQQLKAAAQQILQRTPLRPKVALLLGSGHATIANQLRDKLTWSKEDLQSDLHLPSPLLIGTVDGVAVAVADAPIVSLDSSEQDLTHPIRLLRALGCELLVVTAGAASLSLQIEPGTIAIVEDHINLSGVQPLRGEAGEPWGPRFPDMSEPYNPEWVGVARNVAIRGGIPSRLGVLAAVAGPSMPTRAEYRFLRQAGADLVSMSLVPEVITAVHAGFKVLALVGVTQQILPSETGKTSIEAMIEAAELATPRMGAMLVGLIANSRSLGE